MPKTKDVLPAAPPQRSKFLHTLLEFAPSSDAHRPRKYVSIWRRDIGLVSPEDLASRQRMRRMLIAALLAVFAMALAVGSLIAAR